MKRLYITAEGQTEEAFALSVMSNHLVNHGIYVLCRRVLTKRDKLKAHRGGITNYKKAKADIQKWMLEDQSSDVYFTTMFDYYALPNSFPGYDEAKKLADVYDQVAFLENKIKEDFGDRRFIPYIQIHEFESLIFSKIEALEYEYLDRREEIYRLQEQLDAVGGNPELINSGRVTAPSKRILAQIPEYDKVLAGSDIANLIGIKHLRTKCKHFNEWVSILEKLNK